MLDLLHLALEPGQFGPVGELHAAASVLCRLDALVLFTASEYTGVYEEIRASILTFTRAKTLCPVPALRSILTVVRRICGLLGFAIRVFSTERLPTQLAVRSQMADASGRHNS